MSSLNKDTIAETLHINPAKLTTGGLLDHIDGVAISAGLVVSIIVLLGLGIFFCRKVPKVQSALQKIKNTIFYNFLIRYFQASFISFNFAALTSIYNFNTGYQDIGSSMLILLVQYLISTYLIRYLWTNNLEILNSVGNRKEVGNLYQNLDARERDKVFFGAMFFLQRMLIVLIMVF